VNAAWGIKWENKSLLPPSGGQVCHPAGGVQEGFIIGIVFSTIISPLKGLGEN